MEGAGYTLKTITLEVDGEVVSQFGRTMLRVASTGQILALTGDTQVGQAGRVRASVSGWAGSDPTLMFVKWHEEG